MVLYADDFFKKYWKKRQYKHPEEKKKAKHIAKKFFTAGFNTGVFEQRKLKSTDAVKERKDE